MNERSTGQNDVAIGSRIRQRRNEQKLTQTELGEHLNLSFQQIQKYENGRNRVGANRLIQIAEALDCDISFFSPTYPPGGRPIRWSMISWHRKTA